MDYNISIGWVWRSLVARVDGVHKAAGSIPVTQTKLARKGQKSLEFQ